MNMIIEYSFLCEDERLATTSKTNSNLDTVSCQAQQFAYMTIREFLIAQNLLTTDNSPIVVSDICVYVKDKNIAGIPTMTINL